MADKLELHDLYLTFKTKNILSKCKFVYVLNKEYRKQVLYLDQIKIVNNKAVNKQTNF